jgi:hypothetical protein
MSMDRRRTGKEHTIRSDDGNIHPQSPCTPHLAPDDAAQEEMGSPRDQCGPHVDTDNGEEKRSAGGGRKSPMIVEGSPPISDDVIRG